MESRNHRKEVVKSRTDGNSIACVTDDPSGCEMEAGERGNDEGVAVSQEENAESLS